MESHVAGLLSSGVSLVTSINPDEFVSIVQPLLERQDVAGLLAATKSRWTSDQLVELLHSSHTDAKKLALLAIGLVGKGCCLEELAHQLKDPDPVVNQVAEHAIWSVWFRMGLPEANQEMIRGTQSLTARDFDQAHAHFNRALQIDPNFAEAYNQRAIAFYLQELYQESICDCRRAIRRMPFHFGALAGMGHCQAHLGLIEEAIESYRQALEINPHLHCVREAIDELKRDRSGGSKPD
jgi:tetratricopeptide (TPR) repeat protein